MEKIVEESSGLSNGRKIYRFHWQLGGAGEIFERGH